MSRKLSTSQVQSTHSTGEFKSVAESADSRPVFEDATLGDMVDEREPATDRMKRVQSTRPKRKAPQKKWSQAETKRLHKCVQIFGIDFTLMGRMFSNRTRCELMSKFKKEDKINRESIDKSLGANKNMRLSKYVRQVRNLRKQSLVSVNSLDSTDITIVNQVRKLIHEQEN